MTERPTLAVVLAAGGGTRFQGRQHKLLSRIDGRTIVEHAVAAAIASEIAPQAGGVVVVAGAVDLPDTVTSAPQVTVLVNEHWSDGQASSLGVAVALARRLGAEAIVVGLGDQPSIEPSAWRQVAAATSPIAVATYDGALRNPVRLAREVWDLIDTTGDEGARTLIRMRPDLVQQVPCQGSPADIDTAEDLAQWQNRSSTNSP